MLWRSLYLLGLQPVHYHDFFVQLPEVSSPNLYLGFYHAVHLILFEAWAVYLMEQKAMVRVEHASIEDVT